MSMFRPLSGMRSHFSLGLAHTLAKDPDQAIAVSFSTVYQPSLLVAISRPTETPETC